MRCRTLAALAFARTKHKMFLFLLKIGRHGRFVRAGLIWRPHGPDQSETWKFIAFSRNPDACSTQGVPPFVIDRKATKITHRRGNDAHIHRTETGKSWIFTKIIRIHPNLTSNEIGSHRSTKSRQKSFAHVLSNARPGNRRVTASNEPKLSTNTKNIHHPGVLEPPPSPIKFAKLKIKRQSARKGFNLGHAGGAMCKVWGHGTVELVSTKNRKFHDGYPKKSIKFIQIIA